MENKYYTPEIEEFHVGFEFEQFENNNWQQTTLESDEAERFFVMLNAYELKDFVRVKHLDREDIESLGWKLFKQGNVNFFTFRMFTNDDIQMHFSFGQPAKIGFSTREGEEFSGLKIKNKSELRKLMQQLNINIGGN